jgi:hypothetical protein
MKLNKLLTLLLILLAIGVTTPIVAQSPGGRKREHRNQRGGGLFKRSKSAGHADAFAKGGHKGFLSRIFKGKKDGGAWVYKKTNPGLKQRKEQSKLFSRNRTKNKKYRDGLLAKQNHKRSATRVRGNSSFSKRKR